MSAIYGSTEVGINYFTEMPPIRNSIFDKRKYKIITAMECKREDGSFYYIDPSYRLELCDEAIEQVKLLYQDLVRNNPLNKGKSKGKLEQRYQIADRKFLEDKVELSGGELYQLKEFYQEFVRNNPLNKKKMDEAETVSRHNHVSFAKTDSKRKKRGKFLRKVACTVGVAVGIWASIKASNTVVNNSSYQIVSEDPNFDDSVQESTNNMDALDVSVEKDSGLDFNNVDRNIDAQLLEKSKKELCLGDNFSLNNTPLYYTSMKGNPVVNTKKLGFDQYKIRYIAVISNGDVIDLVRVNEQNKNMKWDEFKSHYSNLDVHFQVNVDGLLDGEVLCKRVGWTSLSNIKRKNSCDKNKEKVFKR